MSTTVCIHGFKRIVARVVPKSDVLHIDCIGGNGDFVGDVALFTENRALSERIAIAINEAIRQHEAEKAEAA